MSSAARSTGRTGRRPRAPDPGPGGESVGSVHVSTIKAPGGPRIGTFYPTVGETVMPDIVRALIALLGP